LKDIRTRVGDEVSTRAATVIVDVCETTIVATYEINIIAHQLEDAADVGRSAGPGWTEPGSPPERGIVSVHTLNETDGVVDIDFCYRNGAIEHRFLDIRAILAGAIPLIEDMGDSKVTGESNLGNLLNSGVDVFGGATNTDVSEEVRWLYGVVSDTR